MKFIIDADLPKSFAKYFNTYDVIHTSALENGNRTKDNTINSLSAFEDRILITKDNDFYYSYIASRRPVKVSINKIWEHAFK